MKIKDKIGGIGQKITSTVFFVATFVYLLYLYSKMKYLPILLVAMLIILPVAVNFFLHLFACKFNSEEPKKPEFEEGTKKLKKFFSSVKYGRKKFAYSFKVLYNKIHKVLQLIFVVLAFAGIELWFILMIPKFTSVANYTALTFLQPIIFGLMFVAAIIVDKWIKHSEPKNERTGAFFHNMRVTFYLTKLSLLLLIAATTIKLLGFYDLQKYLYYAVIGIFYYASAFILISIVVSVLKKEILDKPKLIILLPFAGKDEGDLSVIGFLENNTGITMRGLWSMKLIKKIIPYTVIAVAALFWVSTGIVQVEANQEAVVYRLGVLQDETLKPGLHFTLPAPIDKVEYYNTSVVNSVVVGYEPKEGSDNLWNATHGANEHKLLLGDGNELVSINLRVEYKIKDLKTYVKVNKSPDSMISAHAYNLITQKVIKSDMQTLLGIDRNTFSATIKNELITALEKDNVGVEVVDVFMESIHPPLLKVSINGEETSVAAYYQRVVSAFIKKDTLIIDGQAEADGILVVAQKDANTTVSSAVIKKENMIAAAKSEVSNFMASVKADDSYSDSYRYYKYLDALSKAYGKNTLVIVGDGIDTSKLYFGNFVGGNAVNSGTGDNTANGTESGT